MQLIKRKIRFFEAKGISAALPFLPAGTLDANGYARLEGVPNQSAQVFYGEDPRAPEARVEMPANTFKASASTNEEAIAHIERYAREVEDFWANKATSEQRELRAELDGAEEPEGENAWLFFDEDEQKALQAKLGGQQP